MAITSGSAVFEYDSAVIVVTDPVDAADPQFTVVGDATNPLTPTDKVPLADALLDITLNIAATDGDAVHLYRQDLAVVGTVNDAQFPSATFKNIYVGSFLLDAGVLADVRQYVSLPDIPISASQQFAIEYNLTDATGTSVNSTVVTVRAKSYNTKV